MPSTHASDLVKTYAEVAKGYVRSHGNDVDIPLVTEFLSNVPSNTPILDLGGGVGRDAKYFVNQGWKVTILDLSADMVAIAKEVVPKAQIIIGDMLDIEFNPSSFGGIWASASLLHLTKAELPKILQKINKWLLSKGAFMIKVKLGVGEREISSQKYGQTMQRFFSFYQEDELMELLQTHGFKPLLISYESASEGERFIRITCCKL